MSVLDLLRLLMLGHPRRPGYCFVHQVNVWVRPVQVHQHRGVFAPIQRPTIDSLQHFNRRCVTVVKIIEQRYHQDNSHITNTTPTMTRMKMTITRLIVSIGSPRLGSGS